MSISPVTPNTTLQARGMTQDDFIRILITQLSYQDPLKPVDNQQFMAQMAQFTSLEQTQQLNAKLETLIGNQAALQSVGLIGRTVDVTTDNGVLTGTVTALSLAGASPSLTLRTAAGATVGSISISQVRAVR